MSLVKNKNKQKVKDHEIGFYLKLIRESYGNLPIKELILKLEIEFGIEITKKQIKNYENLFLYEDMEKINRLTENRLEHIVE